MSRTLVIVVVVAALIVGGALLWRTGAVAPATNPAQRASAETPPTPRATADAVRAAFAGRDGAALAALASPRGVRFSPAAFVDTARDRVLTAADLARFWSDDRPRDWGLAEATGDPIVLTPAAFAARYITDRDYVVIEGKTDTGNIATIYPGATIVAYRAEGSGAVAAYDWRELRIVVEPRGAGWALAGIIHDEWTP